MNWENIFLNNNQNRTNVPQQMLAFPNFPSISYYSMPNMMTYQNYMAPTQNFIPVFSSSPMLQQPSPQDIGSNSRNEVAEEPRVPPTNQIREKKKIISCQCIKSKCLKEYCLCFKNGKSCGDQCKCEGCKNVRQPDGHKKRISKKAPITCNCMKSKCSKKYCECYAAGQKCGDSCKCTECMN